MDRPEHLSGREAVFDLVRRDLLGPAPAGDEIDTSSDELHFEDVNEAFGPFVDHDSGEEILCWERPILRYGVGVLFPAGTRVDETTGQPADDEIDDQPAEGTPEDLVTKSAQRQLDRMAKRTRRAEELEDTDESLEVLETNTSRPSSMAVTFALDIGRTDELVVRATGGRYEAIKVDIEGRQRRDFYRRHAWSVEAVVATSELDVARRITKRPVVECEGCGDLDLSLELLVRPQDAGIVLCTAALVNRTKGGPRPDERTAFQCELSAQTRSGGDPVGGVRHYPGRPWDQLDSEERSNELLYRNQKTFSVGHGCSADWDVVPDDPRFATSVTGTPLPTFDVPSITPDVTDAHGNPIDVPMAPLAGLIDGDDGTEAANRMLDAYRSWTEERTTEVPSLPEQLREVATRHLDRCREAQAAMRSGLDLVQNDPEVRRAFELANQAILLQQLRLPGEQRRVTGRATGQGRLEFDEPAPRPDLTDPPPGRGRWRAFQLAFLLLALPSISDPQHPDRESVELIWFPTGGGKTEAYLGLIAFTICLRRLRDPDDAGTDVLMRYTLRLLTAQQFQRASGLIAALEHLRRSQAAPLGDKPISIGIWVGRSTAPNTFNQAKTAFRALLTGKSSDNPFLLVKCPWCRAELGPASAVSTRGRPQVFGYRKSREGGVEFHCSDADCEFSDKLPVHVIDEDIYRERPTMIIGTVDKFAMLAWRPEARGLFGIGDDGEREVSPPSLIVQDELHLISGPLGTMVGLFETAIEELATDRRPGTPICPKIVSSTATIRSFEEQVRGLYARTRTRMFPPPGLDADDSFFARYARYPDGSLREGRKYVGVHATNQDSLITTEVAVLASVLQAPMPFDEGDRDPWWTPLVFFNNLRELGTTLSLLASNVPAQLRLLANRHGLEWNDLRRIDNVQELTSRLSNDEVPRAIEDLEVSTSSSQTAVDCCLASNIIEVGVDIDRLSLMVVVGQPKSAAQYIQVTGRVGRTWWKRPGVVFTLLNPRRPRDRSHYEHFREFHQRLYAAVEPTSVTPFAPSAVHRALHGAMTALVRCLADNDVSDRPDRTPDDLLQRAKQLFLRRVEVVDPAERQRLEDMLERRIRELKSWQRTTWDGWGSDDDVDPMLVPAGSDTGKERTAYHWPTMMSMRTVDAECEVEPTLQYSVDEQEEES